MFLGRARVTAAVGSWYHAGMAGKSFLRLPSRRRAVIGGAILVLVIVGYLLWSPGTVITDGRHDLGHNGIWMAHGYLGDDAWFARNGRTDAGAYRDAVRLKATAEVLRRNHITDLFSHLCPAEVGGKLPGVDEAQVERFLDAFAGPEFRVLPWVGGVTSGTAAMESPAWRGNFARSCGELLARHPRLAGVHLNLEPCASGDAGFLALLTEMRAALPAGKMISVAAYPPPTVWQRVPAVHWEEGYFRQVAGRCDQMVVMMYDTGLHNRRLYQNLLRSWTQEVLKWSGKTPVLLGVPAYEDGGAEYHDAGVENIGFSLAGIHAGLLACGEVPGNYQGVALYSQWTMTEGKWEAFQAGFVGRGEKER